MFITTGGMTDLIGRVFITKLRSSPDTGEGLLERPWPGSFACDVELPKLTRAYSTTFYAPRYSQVSKNGGKSPEILRIEEEMMKAENRRPSITAPR